LRKPGAFPNATALAQARAQGAFTQAHQGRSARAARRKIGDAAGTRALVEVLLGHRHLPAAAVVEGIRRAPPGRQRQPARSCWSRPAKRRR
jgi:hypothetical protein